jgi:hypothetical protein
MAFTVWRVTPNCVSRVRNFSNRLEGVAGMVAPIRICKVYTQKPKPATVCRQTARRAVHPIEEADHTPVGPLIALVGIPLSFMDARTEYSNELGGGCPERVRERLVDVPAWVQSTFAGAPIAELVAEGARSQLRDGGPKIVVLHGAGSTEERSAQHEKLAKDLGAKTSILADISVLFRDVAGGSNCDVKLTAQAQVRVQPVGQPEMKEPSYSVWAEQLQVPLEEWASEPARARAQLDELLATLGRNLIGSYGDRMGCWQQRCEWDATERSSPIRAAPVWCLVDPDAATVRCDFIDYESCATAKPDQRYRCVASGPY